MSKKTPQTRVPKATTDADQRLHVRGVRRKEPDWDAFIAALIAYALREVEEEPSDSQARKESGD